MMNNVFNLEWAKRGGVLRCDEANALFKLIEFFCPYDCADDCNHRVIVASITEAYDCAENYRVHHRRLWGMRMATREECIDAGVEYIEPPLCHEEVVALRKENYCLKAEDEKLKRLLREAISKMENRKRFI